MLPALTCCGRGARVAASRALWAPALAGSVARGARRRGRRARVAGWGGGWWGAAGGGGGGGGGGVGQEKKGRARRFETG